MSLICTIFGHRRSGRDARLQDDGWYSRCKRCGARLQRTGPGRWARIDAPERVPEKEVAEAD